MFARSGFPLLQSLHAPAGKAAAEERWVKGASCWRGRYGACSSKCGFRETVAAAMAGGWSFLAVKESLKQSRHPPGKG